MRKKIFFDNKINTNLNSVFNILSNSAHSTRKITPDVVARMEYLYLATVIAVTLIYFYKKYMKIVKTVEHIPGPPIIPFFGNALMFITKDSSSVIAFAEKIVAKYGYFIRILLGPKIIIVMSDPDDIESFIVDGKATEKSEDYEYTKAWIGEGLVTSTGQKWFSRRKIITPAFHFGILQSFVNTFDCNGNIFVDKLRNYESVDIFQLVVLYALDNICGKIRNIRDKPKLTHCVELNCFI